MEGQIKVVNIISREAIKPYSPTPKHMKKVKLSMLDQISPDMYVPIILFYPFTISSSNNNNNNNNSHFTPQKPIIIASERVQRLRETLAKTLDLYYPFAGRIRNNLFAECNDEGVEFVEAKSPILMSEILKNPHRDLLTNFIPAQPESGLKSHEGSLLLVQATIFDCGGIALGLSFSHKLSDTSTIGGFVRSWAKITLSHNNPDLVFLAKPEFGQACDIFPPINPKTLLLPEKPLIVELIREKCATRRYVFTAENIKTLKGILRNNPTRVEAVSSLIWKTAMKASTSSSSSRSSAFWMAMNMRKRIEPPFGDNVVGNLLSGVTVKIDHHNNKDHDDQLQELVEKLGKGIKEGAKSYSEKGHTLRNVQRQLQETQSAMKCNETEFYMCSSWCRFGLYEADFGWEKPKWVSVVISSEYENSVVLMDTKDGVGIEAWLAFKKEDMAFIETNQDLLAFASFNPSIV